MIKTKEEIAQVLTKIAENEKIAKAELPPVDFRDIPTYQRIRMQAGDTMMHNKEYVESHIGAILLRGPLEKQREFAKKAEEVGKTITFDAAVLYRRLTDVGFGMMGGTGSLTADQLALCFTEIRLLTRTELGMFRVRDPDFQWMFVRAWKDPQSFSDAIRHSLFLTNGLSITLKAMYKQVVEAALENPVVRTTIPVVLVGMTEEEEAQLTTILTHGYTTLDLTDKEITDTLITDTFVTLRETIKKNHKENN